MNHHIEQNTLVNSHVTVMALALSQSPLLCKAKHLPSERKSKAQQTSSQRELLQYYDKQFQLVCLAALQRGVLQVAQLPRT